jgi:hypothetical protein
MQVFQKRDKLVYSPEAQKEGSQDDRSIGSQRDRPFSTNKNEIDTLIQQAHYQVYQFDKVMNYNKNDADILKEFIDPVKDDLLKRNRTLMLINLGKSSTVLNYTSDESTFLQEMAIAEKNNGSEKTNIGVLPNTLIKINHELNDPTMDQLSKLDLSYNEIQFSAFTISGNRYFDLTNIDLKGYDNHKDLAKLKLNSFKEIVHYLSNIRNNLSTKKFPIHWVCYRIKLKAPNQKSRECSQLVFFDFLNPLERIPEKTDKDFKQEELSLDNFVSGMKVIYFLLTNKKADFTNPIHKDKMFGLFSKFWNQNAKLHLIGNIKPINPYYNQNMLVLLLLSNIRKKREIFDSLFIELLFQVSFQTFIFIFPSNLEI